MHFSDYFRVVVGGIAIMTSLNVHHWAAAFCAFAVGTVTILKYIDYVRDRRAKRARVKTDDRGAGAT